MTTIFDDIRRAVDLIRNERPSPTVTIHHPRCRSLATGRVVDCTCGGCVYPIGRK